MECFRIDALLVTGSRAPHIQTVYNTHKSMNKKKTTLLVVDNVADVMSEAVSYFPYFLAKICLRKAPNSMQVT